MKEGLLERIKASGYWRINLRPTQGIEHKLSMAQCRESVRAANVSLRGWDYPHLSPRNDESGGYATNNGFVEDWTDWYTSLEFWRMYQSGQFLHYRAMWEDREQAANLPQRPFLSIEGVIYLFTEVAEFASRLAPQAGYRSDVLISITAFHTTGRKLWVGQSRVPFFEPKTTQASEVEVNETLLTSSTATLPVDTAEALLRDFFDRFGWTPTHDQIRGDQERLLKRRL